MKAAYILMLLLVATVITGCTQQAAPAGTTPTGTDQAGATSQAATAIDNSVVDDNSTVQLGSLV